MARSSARLLGAAVTVNGAPVPGLLELEIDSNAYAAADRFSLRCALGASGYGMWSAAPLAISITVSLEGAAANLLDGMADRVTVDAARNEVTAEGRDLTAVFIDAQIQQSFENQNSSGIVNTLAGRHGLTANAAPTQDLIGRDYQSDYIRTLLAQHAHTMTEWDLLVKLAEKEGFDVWVSGQTLNFQPVSQDPYPLSLTPQDCITLAMARSLQLDSDPSVEVRSWDCRGSQIVSQQAGGAAADNPARYVITRPNLTAQAAQALANRMASLIGTRARVIRADMAGDLETQPRRSLALSNTGTDFDGLYQIASVTRRLSFAHGFSQSLEAVLPSWTN